jgi:hypothetical protein
MGLGLGMEQRRWQAVARRDDVVGSVMMDESGSMPSCFWIFVFSYGQSFSDFSVNAACQRGCRCERVEG